MHSSMLVEARRLIGVDVRRSPLLPWLRRILVKDHAGCGELLAWKTSWLPWIRSMMVRLDREGIPHKRQYVGDSWTSSIDAPRCLES